MTLTRWVHAFLGVVLSGCCLFGQQTSVTLAVSNFSQVLGQPVTLTATLNPPTAAGKVTFYDGVTILGTRTAAGGQAALTTNLLPAGVRSLRAYYGGGGTYTASSSTVTRMSVTANAANSLQKTGQFLLGLFSPVAIADFNGDGRPDLLLFNDLSGETIVVLSNSGEAVVSSGNMPMQAVGDFNGDGKADLVGNNTILFGNGDGTFQAPVSFAGAEAGWLLVADFNGDGKADLAVVDAVPGTIRILLGNGDGSFQPPLSLTANAAAIQGFTALGDFNGDGKPDFLVLDPSEAGTLSVFLGNGDGTFRNSILSSIASDTAGPTVWDFNGDGIADVAMFRGFDELSVALGKGDGTFGPMTYPLPTIGPGDGFAGMIAPGDFNGDGKTDLAVQSEATFAVCVLSGNGDGTFQPAIRYPNEGTNNVFGLAVADFNGDGRTDILTFGQSAGLFEGVELTASTTNLQVSPNPAVYGQTVSLTATVSPASATGTVTFFDGNTQLASGALANGQVTLNTALLAAGPHSLTAVYAGSTTVLGSTSPAQSQVVNRAAAATNITLSTPANPVTFSQTLLLTASLSPVSATGKVTFYDGASLLGAAAVVKGRALLGVKLLGTGMRSLTAVYGGDLLNQPSTSAPLLETVNTIASDGFLAGSDLGLGLGPDYAAVGDFNGDGKSDVALANASGPSVTVLLGNGDGSFRPPVNYAVNYLPTCVVSGDFNRDGAVDLAVASYNGGGITVFMGNGDGTFRAGVNYPMTGNPFSITVGDFNADGKADLVITKPDSGNAVVMLGNGDGTFQIMADFVVGPEPSAIAVGDFNGDGRIDLAVANNLGSASVLLGNGDGSFQPLQYLTSANAGGDHAAAAVGDFDRDGRLDVAFCDYKRGVVGVWLGNGDGTFRPVVNYATGPSSNAVAVGDVNGDGKADLMVATSTGVSVLLGNGDGTFQAAATYMNSGHVDDIEIADFNGDGRLDLVAAGGGGVNLFLGKTPVAVKMPGTKVGVFRNGASFLEDSNGNAFYEAGTDRYIPSFTGPGGFMAGDVPVVGDWTGNGQSKVGIYRGGTWYLDANNNGVYDAGDYKYTFGGLPDDAPFVGDWLGTGKSCIGIYRVGGSVWLLDLNCNGSFDNTPADAFFPFGGLSGDVPVVGAWTGFGTRVGVVRKYAPQGIPQGDPFFWVLDGGPANGGNLPVNHPAAANPFAFGGLPGDVFVTGDWYNNGTSAAGVYRNGFWVLDAGLPGVTQAGHGVGLTFGYGGAAGDVPVVGKW